MNNIFELKVQDNSLVAIVCETPFQIVNVIRILGEKNSSLKKCRIHLYLGKKFRHSEAVYERICKTSYFEEIIPYDYCNISYTWLSRILELFFPCSYLKRLAKKNTISKNYAYIFLPVYLYFGTALLRINKKAKMILYEDGFASYVEKNNLGVFSFVRKLIWWFEGVNFKRLQAEAVILSCPEMYIHNNDTPLRIYDMPILNKEKVILLNEIFNFSILDLYANKRIIYLSQPLDSPFNNEVKDSLLQLLYNKYNDIALLRLHPAEKSECSIKIGMENDQNWELVSINCILDSHILITPFSTAAFLPRLLAGKEPFVIFVYNIFDLSENKADIHSIIKNFKGVYKKQNKIFEILDVNEIEPILNKIV